MKNPIVMGLPRSHPVREPSRRNVMSCFVPRVVLRPAGAGGRSKSGEQPVLQRGRIQVEHCAHLGEGEGRGARRREPLPGITADARRRLLQVEERLFE